MARYIGIPESFDFLCSRNAQRLETRLAAPEAWKQAHKQILDKLRGADGREMAGVIEVTGVPCHQIRLVHKQHACMLGRQTTYDLVVDSHRFQDMLGVPHSSRGARCKP